MTINAMERRIDQLESVLSNLIRVGTVTSREPKSRVRVEFKDRGNLQSYSLQVLGKNTLENKDNWMPDIDEPVICLFLPIGIEQGFVVGSYYPDNIEHPDSNLERRGVTFKDGTIVRYDREAHSLEVNIPESGNLAITVNGPVTVKAPKIDLGQSGLEPVVLGDKLATWITDQLKPWLDSHNHGGAAPVEPFQPGEGASGGNVYSTKNKSQ